MAKDATTSIRGRMSMYIKENPEKSIIPNWTASQYYCNSNGSCSTSTGNEPSGETMYLTNTCDNKCIEPTPQPPTPKPPKPKPAPDDTDIDIDRHRDA